MTGDGPCQVRGWCGRVSTKPAGARDGSGAGDMRVQPSQRNRRAQHRPGRGGAAAVCVLAALAVLGAATATAAGPAAPILLRAWGVPDGTAIGPADESLLRVMAAFRERFPSIRPVPATGISIPGQPRDMAALMQIAGDVAPDVLYVNFRQSDTYIRNRFLSPLDDLIERTAGVSVPNGSTLDTDTYVTRLSAGPGFRRHLAERVPRQCWEVMRRQCPYGAECPYVRPPEAAAPVHAHVWCLPQGPLVTALFYRRDLLAEAGLPDRAPADMDELLQWARRLTHPKEGQYGIAVPLVETGWTTLSFLYAFGGRVVEQGPDGNWRCVFDTDAAVEAYAYVARLMLEPFDNIHGHFRGVVNQGGPADVVVRYAMWFDYVDTRVFQQENPEIVGFGPVPCGPDGRRGSEFNARMTGIYAGLDRDPVRREAAWQYMLFYSGAEADAIQARVFVENGLARFLRPQTLRDAGFPEYADKVPVGWEAALQAAIKGGVPEPYGRNCQQVYRYVSMAVDQIRNDAGVRRCVERGDGPGTRARVREILKARVAMANERMLDLVPEDVRRFRTRLAMAAALAMTVLFAWVFRHVFRVFAAALVRSERDRALGEWQFGRYKLAYLLLLPAVATIAVWAYYPLARGTLMAFQDYNVRGFSRWVGFDNLATVLFSREFWFAMGMSLEYTLLFMGLGFVAPIVLALLLSEVPRGKGVFRTVYYLPAVLSGVVVIFLWKGFYGPYGTINQLANLAIHAVNTMAGTHVADVAVDWLASPRYALLFCLLPSIWAGMGPGCLIYLAALKTVPEELYEAADIDGAGVIAKIRYITMPGIRALVAINGIGSVVGVMKSGSEFIMAMTGGGPYTPYGATEVVGLHLFWEAFGYLRFGTATAMAWVLGSLLIGFTVVQLQRLSRMEYRVAGGR